MCCKQATGACKACTSRTLAFATSGRDANRRYSNLHIRFCPLSFSQVKHKEYNQGMTMFHEMMHIASAAGDKGYSKLAALNLAVRDPKNARLNAATYVFFAGESAQSRKMWLKNTGSAASSPKCFDRYSNCNTIAKGCCHKKAWSNGDTFAGSCCASCKWHDNGKKCGGTRPMDFSRAADEASHKAAKINARRRAISNAIRRCKEDGGKNCNKKAAKLAKKNKNALAR